MPRPGYVLEVDKSTPPSLFWYGEGFRLEKLPAGRSRVIYPGEPLEPMTDVDAAIRHALEHPVDSDPLRALLFPGMKLTIAFDDISLPLPKMRRPDLRQRVIEAVVNVQEALADPGALPETLTGDKGYFSLLEIGRLQELTLKTVISDPRRAQRRFDKLSSAERQSLARAQRSVSSKYGKKLLRKRGQHIERSFAHVLDAGGMRRATLRGLENLNKRHQIAAACYNLSQLLRRLYGIGTPKQWRAFCSLLLASALAQATQSWCALLTWLKSFPPPRLHHFRSIKSLSENRSSSTAC